MEFPMTNDLRIAALYAELARIERSRVSLCEDPMSEGAPIEDFMEGYDRKERAVLAKLDRRAREVGDTAALEFCSGAAERWMP